MFTLIRIKFSSSWLLIMCLFVLVTSGCSIQKRTLLPGFHIENSSHVVRKPATKQPSPYEDRQTTVERPVYASTADENISLDIGDCGKLTLQKNSSTRSTVVNEFPIQSISPRMVKQPIHYASTVEPLEPDIDIDEAQAMIRAKAGDYLGLGFVFLLLSLMYLLAAPWATGRQLFFGGLALASFFGAIRFQLLSKNEAKSQAWYKKNIWQKPRESHMRKRMRNREHRREVKAQKKVAFQNRPDGEKISLTLLRMVGIALLLGITGILIFGMMLLISVGN